MMLGQTTAALGPIPRRWIERFWGAPYVPDRQKWIALRPHLDVSSATGGHWPGNNWRCLSHMSVGFVFLKTTQSLAEEFII